MRCCEFGPTFAFSTAEVSVTLDAVTASTLGASVMLAICPLLTCSVNQRLPSGPGAICTGWLLLVGVASSEMLPEGVIMPILPGLLSSVK